MSSLSRRIGAAFAVASMMAIIGPSAAGAVTFGPTLTTMSINSYNTAVISFRTNTGAMVTCSWGTGFWTTSPFIYSTGPTARTTNAYGTSAGPTFSGCTNSIVPSLATYATSSFAWTMTPTSLASANLTNINFVVRIGSICTITASGVSVPSNTWFQSTRELWFNPTTSWSISESGLCDGGTSAVFAGTEWDLPPGATFY